MELAARNMFQSLKTMIDEKMDDGMVRTPPPLHSTAEWSSLRDGMKIEDCTNAYKKPPSKHEGRGQKAANGREQITSVASVLTKGGCVELKSERQRWGRFRCEIKRMNKSTGDTVV